MGSTKVLTGARTLPAAFNSKTAVDSGSKQMFLLISPVSILSTHHRVESSEGSSAFAISDSEGTSGTYGDGSQTIALTETETWRSSRV